MPLCRWRSTEARVRSCRGRARKSNAVFESMLNLPMGDRPMHALSMHSAASKRALATALIVTTVVLLGMMATAADSLDLVAITGISGPLTAALTQLGSLTPGV